MSEVRASCDTPFTSRRPSHNLFFAIPIPDPVAEDVSSLFQGFKQRYPVRKPQIAAKRLHISLARVFAADSVPDRILELAKLAGSKIRFVEFDLVLNRVLSFRSSQQEKPLVLTTDAGSTHSVNRLVEQVTRTICILSGTQHFRKGSITPHITLTWDRVAVPEQPILPIKVRVREIVLIHSHVGKSRYDILGRWRLVAPQ